MPAIDLINVTKRWGDFYAVDNLNLHIDDYSFITLLGPSGCGKTTTLRMIAGLETPTSGKILINGVPVYDSELGINIPANKRHVGFLFQNYALWPHMTVQKNIEFGLQNLKEYMPVVDSNYTQIKDHINVLKNPQKVIELCKQNINKDGKIDKRRALIAIIDYFKVSMYTAEKVFALNLTEKSAGEVETITSEEIKTLTLKLEDIQKKYDEKGIDLNSEGYILAEPELAEDYIALNLAYNAIKNHEKVLEDIKKGVSEGLKPVQAIMASTNLTMKTAKTLLPFFNSIAAQKGETREETVKKELASYDIQLRRLKSEYLNIGFTLNEKGEKIPSIDFNDKNWNGEKVHKVTLRKLSNEEIDLRVRHVSRVVKIAEFMERYPSELSGGQQQRVAIARTLAPGPKVLFMDEPLSNLDAKLRLEMRTELKRLHMETGSTFIYVTHDQLEAMTLATKICLINNGVLQQYDAPLDVYKKPKNLFVADFVGNPAINFVEVHAHQSENGTIEMSAFNGMNFTFTPTTEIDLAALKAERDASFAEKETKKQEDLKDKKFVAKGNKDTDFVFNIQKVTETMSSDEEKVIAEDEYVIGIRPEFILLNDDEPLTGEIYSALPSGMETIVKIRLDEFLLTSVIFGGVDYRVGSKCKFRFIGKEILLFDRKSGQLLAQGSLKFNQ